MLGPCDAEPAGVDAATAWAARFRARIAPMLGADPCHDVHHLDRVWHNALFLARAEGADEEVLAAAAYLHDLDRAGVAEPVRKAATFLDEEGFPVEKRAAVLEAIERHSDYSFKVGGKRPAGLEARVLQDADNLDAMGAVGVARTFAYAGAHGRPLWAGSEPVRGRAYSRGADGDTVQHFHDKLLRLRGEFNTAAARELAEERHRFMEAFLQRFLAEARGPLNR